MGGSQKGTARGSQNDDLLTIVQMKFASLPQGPKMIAGDLIGTTETFDTISIMIKEQVWKDVGMKAGIFNGKGRQFTCHTNAGAK